AVGPGCDHRLAGLESLGNLYQIAAADSCIYICLVRAAVGTDSRAHKTDVDTGIRSGNLVQITKGLQTGQTVVATGAYGLPDNVQVKIAAPPAGAKQSVEAQD